MVCTKLFQRFNPCPAGPGYMRFHESLNPNKTLEIALAIPALND